MEKNESFVNGRTGDELFTGYWKLSKLFWSRGNTQDKSEDLFFFFFINNKKKYF